ncbi:hypothetical protein DPMN_000219 [Dreissena polymorpha]|uniref:Uncharacterized protein n=1 Tax=Dreissena polymorpha TaxID=45954 RepID=A0A9D4MHT1_DREPO|nr:hypothetical protein DPMN_000219 [Dreissena polymorpha]
MSSVEEVRLEGGRLSWISKPPQKFPSIRKYIQVRKSSAGDCRLGGDAHAPAADRALFCTK